MKNNLDSLASILRELIRAHFDRGDENRVQRYIPRLTDLVIQIESGKFEDFPKEEQIGILRALRGEYLGRGEVFGLLSPKYIEPEYENALFRCINEQIQKLS